MTIDDKLLKRLSDLVGMIDVDLDELLPKECDWCGCADCGRCECGAPCKHECGGGCPPEVE